MSLLYQKQEEKSMIYESQIGIEIYFGLFYFCFPEQSGLILSFVSTKTIYLNLQ